MADEHTIEVSGDDVEGAVETGLTQLGLTRADVDVEIVDEGSGGFLGLGRRGALVRLTVKDPEEVLEKPGEVLRAADTGKSEGVLEAPPAIESLDQVLEAGLDGPLEEDVALEIVENLLEKMNVRATASRHQTEADDLTGERRWVIAISGQDLGLLIGPRGGTLNSFQHVARLMVGHVIHRRPKFLIDVEGYRERHEKALGRLAERMANKAIKQNRSISLEPMSPGDRRIIHLTLRGNKRVFTESIGEGRGRKVQIILKGDR